MTKRLPQFKIGPLDKDQPLEHVAAMFERFVNDQLGPAIAAHASAALERYVNEKLIPHLTRHMDRKGKR